MSDAVLQAVIQGHARQLRTPTIAREYASVARRARDDGWPYEEYLRELLEAELGCELEYSGFAPPVRTEAPGMMESHYAPGVPVEVFETAAALEERARALHGRCVVLSEQPLPEIVCGESIALGEGPAMAVALFATLRRLDDPAHGRILALLPPPEGLGLAVRDRLFRAAKSKVA